MKAARKSASGLRLDRAVRPATAPTRTSGARAAAVDRAQSAAKRKQGGKGHPSRRLPNRMCASPIRLLLPSELPAAGPSCLQPAVAGGSIGGGDGNHFPIQFAAKRCWNSLHARRADNNWLRRLSPLLRRGLKARGSLEMQITLCHYGTRLKLRVNSHFGGGDRNGTDTKLSFSCRKTRFFYGFAFAGVSFPFRLNSMYSIRPINAPQ
jgi:hypothetical protein